MTRQRWIVLVAALLVAAVVQIAALLADAPAPPGPRIAATLSQVYRLPSGATRVDLTVFNVGTTTISVGAQHVRIIDDAGQLWECPPGAVAEVGPSESQPLTIMGAVPEDRRVTAVVVVVPGAELVTLPVEPRHRRGEW